MLFVWLSQYLTYFFFFLFQARSDYDDDLNHSLNLTEEIDDLTRKMMDTVDGELRRARRKKEFGSSVW
jgi:hypothetical protein